MIAKNHEKIFKAIHDDLKAGLDRSGQSDGAYPYALYLGNWMADFSQLCSPDLPNMLIESLDLPDLLREFSIDALAFLDGMEKELSVTVGAAITKASMDKQALKSTLEKVKASPYQDKELLKQYAEYLKATPTGLLTPQPALDSGKKKIVLSNVSPDFAQRRELSPNDIAVLVATLVKHMIVPLFGVARAVLKSTAERADAAEDGYLQIVEFLKSMGFVDKFNGTAELAIWLLGLFKFSNPAKAVASNAPTSGSAGNTASTSGTLAVPPFRVTPRRPFVVPPSIANAQPVADHISPNVYSELFAKYFGFYKPYEHLDRFMDAAQVAEKIGGGPDQATLDRKRKFRHYRKDNYPQVVTPIASLKATGIDLDATLWRGLQIAFGRLAALRDADGKALPINEKLLLIGRSFHVFEDYFAHTNFVDRLVYSMQLEHGFDTHPFELKKILLSVASEDAFNAVAADKSLFGNLDCANPKVRQIIEKGATECVKSGFYDTPDTIHSLVHLAEGLVKHALEMKDVQRDSQFDFYDALENYALNRFKSFKSNLDFSENDLLKMLRMDREMVFLDEGSFAKIASSNPLIGSMGSNGKIILELVNQVFWLILAYHTAKNLKNAYTAVNSAVSFFVAAVKIVKTLYFTPNVILRYLKITFQTVPEPIRDELIALAIEVVKEVCRTLASTVFGWVDNIIEKKVRYGSHSLMAKDEDTDQGRLYALAEQFGILIDKAAIEFVFPEPSAQTPEAPKAQEILERLLDGIAYNPLTLERDALSCESRGLLTRFTLENAEQRLDPFLKECVNAFLIEDKTFAQIPGFVLSVMDCMVKARWATAMRTMARLNSDRIVLIAGNDSFYLADARFELLKPASVIDLIVFKSASVLRAETLSEVVVQPWTVRFANDFMDGAAIDWSAYRLAKLTEAASAGVRRLPNDYRILADQFIGDYTTIWRSILVIPGMIGDNEWAITRDNGRITSWV